MITIIALALVVIQLALQLSIVAGASGDAGGSILVALLLLVPVAISFWIARRWRGTRTDLRTGLVIGLALPMAAFYTISGVVSDAPERTLVLLAAPAIHLAGLAVTILVGRFIK